MKNNFFKVLLPIVFWCFIWQIGAMAVDNVFLLPDIPSTLSAFFSLFKSPTFYKVVFLSALRVILGLSLGCIVGTALAILCHKFTIISSLVTPIITVIKSTPVASFIIVLWVLLSGDALSIFIGFLMVMPIIWQNLIDGYNAIDFQLTEVAEIFEFSFKKRLKILILPTLKDYFIPAIITASGLAWKAEIAAEIIAYTKNSIGQGINDAKYNMETATVFAWTLVIILLSIMLEYATRQLLRRSVK